MNKKSIGQRSMGAFTTHAEEAYYDVVPFQMPFPKIKGVADFYETFTKAFPDFQIIVHTENDVPAVSIREVQINGTHSGEYSDLCRPPAAAYRFP